LFPEAQHAAAISFFLSDRIETRCLRIQNNRHQRLNRQRRSTTLQASPAFLDYSVSLNSLFGFPHLIRKARRLRLQRGNQPNEMQFNGVGGLPTQITVSAHFALIRSNGEDK
jgi:hypothetical protein